MAEAESGLETGLGTGGVSWLVQSAIENTPETGWLKHNDLFLKHLFDIKVSKKQGAGRQLSYLCTPHGREQGENQPPAPSLLTGH